MSASASVIMWITTLFCSNPSALQRFRRAPSFCALVRPRCSLVRMVPEQRRIRVQSCSPSRSFCRLSEASCEVIRMWLDLASSGTDVRSLMLPPKFECTAFADACADAASVGMGGFVRLPDSRQLFFQVMLTQAQMLALLPWLPPDCSLQSYIATWELAAQSALLLLLHQLLGEGHLPIHTVFRCDNSASEFASWKGLSMAVGLCVVLRSFSHIQERMHISVHIDHIPGIAEERILSALVSPRPSVWMSTGVSSPRRLRCLCTRPPRLSTAFWPDEGGCLSSA